MSMLMSAVARISNTKAARPGSSRTPAMVIFASPRSCATPEMIGASTAAPSSSSAVVTNVPGESVNDERTRSGVPDLRAYSTSQVQDLRAVRCQLEHLFIRDDRDVATFGAIRGSAVKIPSTSV